MSQPSKLKTCLFLSLDYPSPRNQTALVNMIGSPNSHTIPHQVVQASVPTENSDIVVRNAVAVNDTTIRTVTMKHVPWKFVHSALGQRTFKHQQHTDLFERLLCGVDSGSFADAKPNADNKPSHVFIFVDANKLVCSVSTFLWMEDVHMNGYELGNLQEMYQKVRLYGEASLQSKTFVVLTNLDHYSQSAAKHITDQVNMWLEAARDRVIPLEHERSSWWRTASPDSYSHKSWAAVWRGLSPSRRCTYERVKLILICIDVHRIFADLRAECVYC